MINPEVLLADLKRLLGQLEGDLRERADEVPALGESLRAAYNRAKQAERTAQPFETWHEDYLTQVATAWILACVFVRFIEDNGLIETPLLAGSGPRLDEAKDQRTIHFQGHSTDSDREYLYYVFRKVEGLPAAAPLFDERHNPLWAHGVSGDGATLLIEFWQRIDPSTGALAHDFTDPALNTRFLGDLYQDLSEDAQKKYALLQTPEFVEEFILDRTLTPAIAEFGLEDVRLIDPACGSGHFLLGAFHRLLHEWQRREPAINVRELAQNALEAIHGVDLNPYAIAIARFRVLIAALKASGIRRLADAPAFRMNLATGDSLLHGPRPGGERQAFLDPTADPLRHVYETEDATDLRRILGAKYHVVVGNPPYIGVEDEALNRAYRERFGSCYRQYSLAVPFMERFFDLALDGGTDPAEGSAGFVGMITASYFMTREFGKRLVEEYVPRWDITHIIDTQKAHIPGHGTPTVIIFGRHRKPVAELIRCVVGIRGEATVPALPATAAVWTAITRQVDIVGSSSPFVVVSDRRRDSFYTHPWSLVAPAVLELKEQIERYAGGHLEDLIDEIGRTTHTGEDEVFYMPRSACATRLLLDCAIPLVVGEDVRDFTIKPSTWTLFPYDRSTAAPLTVLSSSLRKHFWANRTVLRLRLDYGQTPEERGLLWYEHSMFFPSRFRRALSIAFPEVATHNHFVFDRGGKVFKQTAPVILMREPAGVDEYLGLAGLLNSSVVLFWLRQVAHNKGGGGIGGGLATESWERFLQLNASRLDALPIPPQRPQQTAKRLDSLAQQLEQFSVESALAGVCAVDDLRNRLKDHQLQSEEIQRRMVAEQEELDWECYSLYGLLRAEDPLTSNDAPALNLGERAFEIVMARRMRDGELQTAWFERHGSTPITEPPSNWPPEYRRTVEKRIALIEADPKVAMIEQPEYKRRWNRDAWAQQQGRALRDSLLNRLEAPTLWSAGEPISVAKLSDRMRSDPQFMQAAELYRDRADFDVLALVSELVESDAVPFLPVLRYSRSGMRKHEAWKETWELQRREDTIDAHTRLSEGDPKRVTPEEAKALKREQVGDIPPPPQFNSADFLKATWWRLRGKLDVAKERFISYPHAEREADATLVIVWAGWDHLSQAKALAGYHVRMKEQEAWAPARLKPLLAGLLELVPWLKQWHNDLDPAYGIGMGDYFAGFVDEEARALGFTLGDLRAWQPPAGNTRRRRRASV